MKKFVSWWTKSECLNLVLFVWGTEEQFFFDFPTSSEKKFVCTWDNGEEKMSCFLWNLTVLFLTW